MSLNLNVDGNTLKMGINVSSEHKSSLGPLLAEFLQIEVQGKIIYCTHMTFSEFT